MIVQSLVKYFARKKRRKKETREKGGKKNFFDDGDTRKKCNFPSRERKYAGFLSFLIGATRFINEAF